MFGRSVAREMGGWGGGNDHPAMRLKLLPPLPTKNLKRTFLLLSPLLFSACSIPKKTPTEFTITLTPQELASYSEYQANGFEKKVDELKTEFGKLRKEISKEVKDCICPSEMK